MPDRPVNPDPPDPCHTAQARVRALQQRALEAELALRAPPPWPTSCCGRGCNGCVWESYHSALDYWCEEANLKMLYI